MGERVDSRTFDVARGSPAPLVSSRRERLVGQLTGGIAHDFNNILATVLGCLELMERRTDDPDRLRMLLKRATDAVDRATELTSAVVQFSRREPRPAGPVDVNEIATALLPLIHSALGRRVRLETHLSASLPQAHAEPTTLEAAVLALCLAARRALPEGGHLSLSTEIDPARRNLIRISVLAEGDEISAGDMTLAEDIAELLGTRLECGAKAGSNGLCLGLVLPISTAK